MAKKKTLKPKEEKNDEIEINETKTGDAYYRQWHHHQGDRSSFVSAFFLIGIGVLLILNNFGFVDWSIWNILWRFWPVVLIFFGLRTLFGRSREAEVGVGIFGIIAICSIFLYALATTNINVNTWIKNNLPQKYHHYVPLPQSPEPIAPYRPNPRG